LKKFDCIIQEHVIEKERTEQKETMSGTELIMGMEEVVQHIRELEEREKNLKEALAKKFYDHYDDMNYNKLNIARTVGPNLGRMIEHLIKENKRLQEENAKYEENNPRCLVYEVEKLGEMVDDEREMVKEKARILANYRSAMCDIENWNEDLECINDILPHLKKLKEENKKLKEELEKSQMSDKSARMTLSETIDKLEMAKEIAYQCGVELFCDDDSSDED